MFLLAFTGSASSEVPASEGNLAKDGDLPLTHYGFTKLPRRFQVSIFIVAVALAGPPLNERLTALRRRWIKTAGQRAGKTLGEQLLPVQSLVWVGGVGLSGPPTPFDLDRIEVVPREHVDWEATAHAFRSGERPDALTYGAGKTSATSGVPM